MTHKVCTKCKVEKPVEAFSKHRGKPGGLRYECKECGNAEGAKWRKANPDYQHRHYLANREAVLARTKAYRENNLEACRARARKYGRENKEKVAAYQKQWVVNNRERHNAKSHRRRALELSVDRYEVTPREMAKMYASNCFYCGAKGKKELDHVVPISRGGQHSIGNLVAACVKCNRSKNSKTIMEWRMTLDRNENGAN